MLIVIDGLDGSGKATQSKLLVQNIGEKAMYVTFPNYESKSSELIKMYLNKEIRESADEVNPYAASMFYTADRYITFEKEWGTAYKDGKIIVADRYTTSNLIHQMAKMPENEWDTYAEWLVDTEYGKVGLPVPEIVFFLYVPIEVSQRLMEKRYNGDSTKKDLHESDVAYLKRCEKAALYATKKLGWVQIDCTTNGEMRSIEDIQAEIFEKVKALLL